MKTHIYIISNSIKNQQRAEVLIDGKVIIPNKLTKRGINIIVLGMNLKPVSCRYYDFNKDDLNDIFIKEIKNIPNNNILILLIKGDGFRKINKNTRDFIKNELKSTRINLLQKHQAWCYVTIKYENHYKHIVEEHQEVKAVIDNFYDLSIITDIKLPIQNINYLFSSKLALISPIKAKTTELKHKLSQLEHSDMIGRLKLLHNQYKGATCYIISCGPSVNEYNPQLIKRLAGHNLVFSIKQAITQFMDITDFHLYNFCNLYHYQYPNNRNIITGYMSQKDIIGRDTDLNFMLDREYQMNAVRSQSYKYPPLSKIMNFESYTMDKIVNRPSGPGIMYEFAIYLAVHLGVSEIITIGWDVSYPLPKTVQTPNGQVVERLENTHFYGSNSHTQKNIDKIINENEFIIQSSKILNMWLKLHQIDLYLMSNLSRLDITIPRIDARKIYNIILNEDTYYNNNNNPIHNIKNNKNITNNSDINIESEFMKYCRIDSIKPILKLVQININDVDKYLQESNPNFLLSNKNK